MLRMTFGGKHPFDFGYRGVGISSSGNTPAVFSGAKAQARWGTGTGMGTEMGMRMGQASISIVFWRTRF